MISTSSWICVVWILGSVIAQDCQSNTYNFTRHYDPLHQLDLTIKPNQVIRSYAVSRTLSASTTNEYIQVNVENDELIFRTSANFSEYEKREEGIRINMLITFTCQSGQLVGSYYQDLLEANNHAPEFSRSDFKVTLPLPLPKHFDLSPFIDDGRGVVAMDYDLVNNSVQFSVGENPYVRVESVKVSSKVFRGVLKLKEQILKLPEVVELIVVATDQGVPAKSSSVQVLIYPDFTIEYDEPPVFKRIFFHENVDLVAGNTVVVEVMPGTVYETLEYSLVGEDATYFNLSVAEDKSNATVTLRQLPKDKYFLSVVVEAKRSELQKAECVILIDLKSSTRWENTTVEKTLSILHLLEEQEHHQVFPSKVDECSYEIVHQIPNRTETIFKVDASSGWIVSSKFDREDSNLFEGIEPPQFQLVLQLNCPNTNDVVSPPPVFKSEIPYSRDITYISAMVDDINDHAPVFTFPRQNAIFAFPVARISERLLPSKLLKVSAHDEDAGLNAIIRFSLAPKEDFDIDSKTGVIYPLKHALSDEASINLEITATDRDGAADGNDAKVKITVIPAVFYQLSVLQLEDVDEERLDDFIGKLQTKCGCIIQIVSGGYTSVLDSSSTDTKIVQRLIVAAFDDNNDLVSSENLAKRLSSFQDVIVSNLGILESYDQESHDDSDECTVYPYIVVMSVFIVLFVATCALSAYFWFKWRVNEGCSLSSNMSDQSDDVLVENVSINAGCTPPAKRKEIDDATIDYSSDSVSRSNRAARIISEMLIIDEDENEGASTGHSNDTSSEIDGKSQQRKKSIRFSEDVERIEVIQH